MTLASFFSWADRFQSNLVGNPEDRFSRDVAQLSSNAHLIYFTDIAAGSLTHNLLQLPNWLCYQGR